MANVQIPENVEQAYFMLEEVKREKNVLETREKALKHFLTERLKDGPVDGIEMRKIERRSTSWAKVVSDFKTVLDHDQKVVLEEITDEYTKVSESFSFKPVKEDE